MGSARRDASAIRDKARGDGRQILEDMRSRAGAEASSTLQAANDDLSRQGRQTADELQTSIETLSATLASRVLGVDVGAATTTGQGR
jgi:F-type H+-transporting ATPase subunit b